MQVTRLQVAAIFIDLDATYIDSVEHNRDTRSVADQVVWCWLGVK